MPFPTTRQSLQDNGYSFSHTKECAACHVSIEMWNTPKGNIMPLDFKETDGIETCVPHFATCKQPEQFSRRLAAKKKKAEDEGPSTKIWTDCKCKEDASLPYSGHDPTCPNHMGLMMNIPPGCPILKAQDEKRRERDV
jgi:hypothetical protein